MKIMLAENDEVRRRALEVDHDPLTGLWNREGILHILDREMARGEQEGKPVGAIMADLDHFKLVNDRYGQSAGDAVLREAAFRVASLMRPGDSASRYGSDKFLLVLPDCNQGSAAVMAQRILFHIADDPMQAQKRMIPVSLSIGAAVSRPGGSDAAGLVRAADLALCRAKGKGRNRVEVGRVEGRETRFEKLSQ